MPEFTDKACRRIANVVRQVENDGLRRTPRRDIRAVPQVPEIRAIRITSATPDGDGFYPGQLIQPDSTVLPASWDDITDCLVQPYQGTLTVGRIRGERIGENASGVPIFSPVASVSFLVRKNSTGSDFGPRRRLNLIEGSNVTMTVADDPTDDEVDVTIGSYQIPVPVSVMCATTGNVDLTADLTDGQTIDGFLLQAGDLILVKDQTDITENGVYQSTVGSAIRFPVGYGTTQDMTGRLVQVQEGTLCRDTLWMCELDYYDGALGGEAVNWIRLDHYGVCHLPVRVATTVAGTLSTAFDDGETVDGITIATGDRILIKNQAAPAENGIYTVKASGSPTRCFDANTWIKLTGTTVAVQEGTTNADSHWLCTSNNGGTLETTAVTWANLNTITGSTLTSLSGVLIGNGTNVGAIEDTRETSNKLECKVASDRWVGFSLGSY